MPRPLEAMLDALATPGDEASWRPSIVRLRDEDEAARLRNACAQAGIVVLDTIDRQLRDLAAVHLPAGSDAERAAFRAHAVTAAGGSDRYGSWVYLPWARTLAHLLDADEYHAVITDRNRDKITRDEQLTLRAKRVGVVGLSVGGEAAVTLAQEHLCGEIVLADFDRLDLSNLNRLNAGFDDLGVNKAVLIARRIVRLNPYVRITLHPEGVTAGNMDAFLDGLDLLVEECDGLALKYTMRQRAKERGLNIIFGGDERGFLSVEPHAHVPDLEPFHGRVSEPQQPREAYATQLDFMRALTVWLGGWDAISERSRRSLERIGTELCGYPQLAGEARFAAGQLAHVARRLLLGERLPPSIGFLDLEEWIPPVAAQ